MKARAKKWFALGALGVVILVLVSSRSSSTSTSRDAAALRSSRTPSSKTKMEVSQKSPEIKNSPKVDEPKADEPPPPPKADEPPPPKCIPVANSIGDSHINAVVNIEKGADEFICGRKLPINLSDQSTWSTPHTPSLDPSSVPADNKEVVLLKKQDHFGSLGCQLNSFFHAYDVAYDAKLPLYITKDSWVLETLFPLFFGPSRSVEKNTELYSTIEETLGVKFVESEEVLKSGGMTVPNLPMNPTALFYTVTKNLKASEIRDRRDTILRKLFQYPSQYGAMNVCSTFQTLVGKEINKKYTVIHIADPAQKSYMSKLSQSTGEDHTAASEMRPDYVKNILQRLDMLEHDIYPVDSNENVDHDVHTRLLKDPDLASHIKCVKDEWSKHTGGNIYLAVMADVYLGNPLDQMSLWVARMRFALGMKNTFIFTEKKGDQWVSYFNDDTYLYLYDSQKLGTPWMG